MEQFIETFIKIFSISIIRYFVVAGIPFLVCYKLATNWFTTAKIQSKEAEVKDFIREIGHSLQTTVIFTIISYLIFFTPLKNITQIYSLASDHLNWWIFVSVALSLFIHDTYFYWLHRLLHHPKIFRYTHLLHHESTNPSPWASYSFNFLEAWTEGFVLLVIVVLLPMNIISVGLFVLISFMINVYGHLGYEILPACFRKTMLFQLLNTSVHHNLHHSKFKSNYGLYFRIWDRIMGTEHSNYVKEFDRIQYNRFGVKKKRLQSKKI